MKDGADRSENCCFVNNHKEQTPEYGHKKTEELSRKAEQDIEIEMIVARNRWTDEKPEVATGIVITICHQTSASIARLITTTVIR